MAHLIWLIRIVGAHRRAPNLTINLFHHFSCVSPVECVRRGFAEDKEDLSFFAAQRTVIIWFEINRQIWMGIRAGFVVKFEVG
ncbi:hypothetical protein [Coleofasciculus sp.]|uniref:hypothetical protein n=1 Tax=Coleofasciculus sp. TaxID=3100458 RepID=UPI003A2E3E24